MGYKRPPRKNQFKPGESGNRKGRPRTRLSEAEIIAKVRDEPVRMLINGKTVWRSSFEAAVRRVHIEVMTKGKPRDLEQLFKLYERYGALPKDLWAAEMKAGADVVMDKIMQAFDRTQRPTPPKGGDREL